MPRPARVVNVGSVVFPRVSLPVAPQLGRGSYKAFLFDLARVKENKKILPFIKKAEIDAEFERQLKDKLQDESLVAKFMRLDARTTQSHKLFSNLQEVSSQCRKPVAISPNIEALILPLIGNHPKNSKKDIFDLQTYEDFASKAKKKNPDFELSKETMDQAFTLVATRFQRKMSQIKATPVGFDRMMARVLGKKSSRYWERAGR